MARIIVTANPTGRSEDARRSREKAPVLLDEQVESIHLSDGHAADQLIERLAWAVTDAESVELAR